MTTRRGKSDLKSRCSESVRRKCMSEVAWCAFSKSRAVREARFSREMVFVWLTEFASLLRLVSNCLGAIVLLAVFPSLINLHQVNLWRLFEARFSRVNWRFLGLARADLLSFFASVSKKQFVASRAGGIRLCR